MRLMSTGKVTVLDDRGVIRVDGEDAYNLLQSLITNDMGQLERQPAIFAGLLSPQGKILFEFFVAKDGDGLLLETARDRVPDLIKRLNFYKLRAKASFADASADLRVAVIWNGAKPGNEERAGSIVYPDPRLSELGLRAIAPLTAPLAPITSASLEEYHAHRIALGVPEGGRDYALGDTFPHEALYDQLEGVDFAKGCYVGQEIVSRMEHRGTARKRVVPIVGAGRVASGAPVKTGAAAIGTVGSVHGTRALALLRLDRASEALEHGEALTAGEIPVSIELPKWVRFTLTPKKDTAEA
jgi:folate-binding protein YgfZ